MGPRGQFDLVEHKLIQYDEFVPGSLVAADNWIISPSNPEDEWMRSLMIMVGDWRSTLRSTYIRWALAINGLHVASDKYKLIDEPSRAFEVRSVHSEKNGTLRESIVSRFTYPEAAAAHLKVQPMLCAHGFIDMYSGLEEMIFAFYRSFLSARPEHILRGDEFKELRKAHRKAKETSAELEAWEALWKVRLDKWHRNKLYDGLGKVFRSFCSEAGVKTPAGYQFTTVETWAESIGGISLVRNALVHGATEVPKELATFCAQPHALGFDFVEGQPLRLRLFDLQVVQLFCDQLLTALNLSLVELARPEVREQAKNRFKKV